MYRRIISFDVSVDVRTVHGDTLVHKYLDAYVHFSFSTLRIAHVHPNEGYAITGEKTLATKCSILPYLGPCKGRALSVHRAELKGRLYRWTRLNLEHVDLIVLVVIDMLVYLREGFLLEDVKKIWRAITHSETLNRIIYLCLSLLRAHAGHIEAPLAQT